MELASNVARVQSNYRRGKKAFVAYPFWEYAKLCDKTTLQFCTWYAYEKEALYEYCREKDWSITGFHYNCKPDLYFEFIPFDFDADSIEASFQNTNLFIGWLQSQGIPESHYSIWLSGSKGFHVEVDRAAFEIEHPSKNVHRKVHQLCERLIKEISTQNPGIKFEIDLSLYSSARLYRVPNTYHPKTGLFKTNIPLEKFTWEYVEQRVTWADKPGDTYNQFDHSPVPSPILLPLVEETKEVFTSPELIADNSKSIIDNCIKIQQIMVNPEGRESRRQAAGTLMEAYGYSEAPEVTRLYEAWEQHPYMDENRYKDADKWKGEFDREGVIKCAKTCTSFGCDRQQKKICGTQYPTDHLYKVEPLEPISIEEAREYLGKTLDEIIYQMPGFDVATVDLPIGLGKTTTLVKKLSEDEKLSAVILTPTHELAEQIINDLNSSGVDSTRHLRSRGELSKARILECPFIDEINAARFSGINVAKSICSKCPRFPANMGEDSEETVCEYYQQYDGLKEIRVVVGVHSHANSYVFEQAGIKDRSFLAIDESPIAAFSGEIAPVDYEAQVILKAHTNEIVEGLIRELEGEAPEIDVTDIRPGLFGNFRAVQAATEKALETVSNMDNAVSEQQKKQMAIYVYKCLQAIIAGIELTKQDAELLASINYGPQWITLLNRIIEKSKWERAMELKEGFRHLVFPDIAGNAIKCIGELGLSYHMGGNYFYPTEMPECKVIILDATSNKTLYEKLVDVTCPPGLARKLVYYKLPYVEQSQVHITQITNSGYSKTRIGSSEDVLGKLTFVVSSLRQTFPESKLLCVSVLDLKAEIMEEVDSSGKTEFAHFKALRGKNKYENYPLQVILGGFFIPNAAVVQGLNRLGIYHITEEILEASTITVRNKHIARNGDTYFSQRKAFRIDSKDSPLVYANLLVEQNAVSEVVQAVRLRLFSGEGDKRCYILTNIGLSTIYADKFCTLEELTTELEDLSGIKSDLDTSITRREALWFAKLGLVPVGATLAAEDIGEYDRSLRRFLANCEANGILRKVKPKTYIKERNPEERDLAPAPQAIKETKATVQAKLDAWMEKQQPGFEFTNSDLALESGSSSVRFLREWLQSKIDKGDVVKIGETRGAKYRKISNFTGGLKRYLGL